MNSRRLSIVLVVLMPLLCTGCGYNSGYSTVGEESKNKWYQWRSLYREDVRTVAVPIFKNKDYRRGVEFSLSKAGGNPIEKREIHAATVVLVLEDRDRDGADIRSEEHTSELQSLAY